jgi:hypothetical protein
MKLLLLAGFSHVPKSPKDTKKSNEQMCLQQKSERRARTKSARMASIILFGSAHPIEAATHVLDL